MRLPAWSSNTLLTQTWIVSCDTLPLLLLFPLCLLGSAGPSELGDIVAAAVFSRS